MIDSIIEILFEEDYTKTVAIYGGGFKPPTKGHFTVAQEALKELPDIDELKIFVGGGVRDGVSQNEAIQIWNIYKNYLSPKVDVEASVAPVKSVLGYAKENPDTKVYWVLGTREGNEEDLSDIENRTKSLSKYPNLEVKVITTTGGVSGTKTRNAVKDNNKELFISLIPDIKEKEQIWNIVSPVVKEEINEVDNFHQKALSQTEKEALELTYKNWDTFGGKECNNGFCDIFAKNLSKYLPGSKIMSTEDPRNNTLGHVWVEYEGKYFDAETPNGVDSWKQLPWMEEFYTKNNSYPSDIENLNEVGEANLKPYKWQELDMNGYVIFARFVTDSETQYDVNLTVTNYVDDDFNNLKALEVEFIAKPKGAEGSSAKIVVNKGELYKVMSTITAIIKHYIKKFKAKAIMYSPSKKSDEEDFGTQRDNLYKAFISKALPGVKFEKNSNFITAILPNTINELVTDTEVICDNCSWEWKIADGGDDLYTCHKCGHDNTPKKSDPFGLNEYAKTFVKEVFEKTWDLQEGMLSLSRYMIDNGMNIKPLPKIKVIKDDKENASNLLGKTAYYNPNEKSITLYTMDRHPKDILRSFAHEMIHHEQNLNGKLNNITTQNTNEDGDLPEIEREAYEKGNMMLRNWEDSIKNV
jgi:hypothetical protein